LANQYPRRIKLQDGLNYFALTPKIERDYLIVTSLDISKWF